MPPAKNIRVFISYRNIPLSKTVSADIASQLETRFGYEIFIDTQKLKDEGGVRWAEAIYENARMSDVLMVLLEQTTAESEWVQREVDVARGAHVQILPVVIIPQREIDKVFADTQQKLAISDMQYLLYTGADNDYEVLRKNIERLSKITRDTQRAWIIALDDRRRVRQAGINPDRAVYGLRANPDGPRLHLATGDATQFTGMDVIVNTENNYMQMARNDESMTLSSALRRAGSWMSKGRIYDDTVQRELNEQIYLSTDFGGCSPIEMEQVVPTHAGHPKSQLVQNGIRYIFHVATVYVHPRERTVKPISSDSSIQQAVLNCLNMALEVDSKQGVISPESSKRFAEETAGRAAYQPIRTIVFPLFGTGRAGRSVAEVAPPMIAAFRQFMAAPDAHSRLEHIYLSVFSESDLVDVERAIGEDFEAV
jgi:O-acetyl-ADP-ribose deacetylase (regulator of RNase III)